jgi:hypothetical protein
MQTDKQLGRPGVWTWATPALIAGVSLVWYYIVARAEGLIWVSQRFTQVQGMLWPIAGTLGAAFITGWGIGAAVSKTTWSWVRRIVALGLSAAFLALLGFLSRWAGLIGAPDWLAISAMVIAGGCFAFGYAFSGIGTAGRPVWPALAIPVLLAGITAVQTESLGDLIAVVVLTALSIAVGKAGLRRIGAGETGFPVTGAFGLSMLIVLFRVTGACGWVSSSGIIVTLAVTGIVVRRELLETFSICACSLRTPRQFRVSEWAVLGAGVALALVFWCSSLAPETGPDGVGARSALPLIWERAGAIIGVPEMFTSYMGLGGEIINLIVLPLAGGNMAKITSLVSAFFLVGCISSAGGESRRLLSWLAAFVFFSSTVVSWQFVHGFVDMHVAFLTVASMLAFESWISDRRNVWLLAAGLIAGTAVSIKLHAGTLFVLSACLIVYECWKHRGSVWNAWQPLLLLSAGIALALVPSVIRSYILTGSPVFPFANDIFPSQLALDWAKQLPSYGSGFSLQVFTLPFRTVLSPASFNELGTYHPATWILALFGLALLPWSGPSGRRWWLVSIIFWLGWIMTEQNLRYSLPALACTIMAIASSGGTAGPKWFLTSWVGLLLVAVGVVLGYARPTAWMWHDAAGAAFPKNFLLGTQSAEQFYDVRLPSSALAKVVNAESGTKAVVWQVPFVRDHQNFLGRTIAHPHGDIRQLNALLSILPNRPLGGFDESIYQVIKTAGLTHVMWENSSPWITGRPESAWGGFYSTKFTEKYLELTGAQNGAGSVRLYRVRSEAEILKGPVKVTLQPWIEGEIAVKPGMLIGVQAKWNAQPPADAFLDIFGLTSDQRMPLWTRMSLAYTMPASWHRQWQTVPEGVTKLHIYRPPSSKDIEVVLVWPAN